MRHGGTADLDAVADLHWASRRSAYRHFLPQTELDADSSRIRAGWAARFETEQHTHRLLLAETPAGLVGFSYFGPDLDPQADDGADVEDRTGIVMLNALHAHPASVGTGVGRLLMIRTLEIMVADGATTARLWVLAENTRAREFYRKGGWTPDGMSRLQSMFGVPTPQLRYTRQLREAL
jgi:GNAT superfamily N-acetyltransferase